jgi:hypothetical protein
MFGEGKGTIGKVGGWLGTFFLQYNDQRISEWLGSIEDIGHSLWELLGRVVTRALQERGVGVGRLAEPPSRSLAAATPRRRAIIGSP